MPDKENLYSSSKVIKKLMEFYGNDSFFVRICEIQETGWFNKKESYIKKRLKYNRKEKNII